MSRIRIVAMPPGQAPEEIRRQWIGLEMETVGPAPADALLRGAVDGEPDPAAPNANGYCVSEEEALRALDESRPEAAAWWRKTLSRFPIGVLVFKREVCLLLP